MPDLTFAEFDGPTRTAWLERTLAEFAAERESSGDSAEHSREAADHVHRRFFPDGEPVPGQLAGTVMLGDEAVGMLWIGPREPESPDSPDWWVWNVEILPERRGQGLGRRAMRLAEEIAAAHGAVTLGLNVFGRNAVARHLYESLGYQTMAMQMRKALDV